MARRRNKYTTCPKNKFRFLTPSLCSVCDSMEKCYSFREYYKRNKRKYNKFVYETIEKFPEKYQLEVGFMPIKQTFIQIVDKKTGKIEEVIDSKTLDALDIEKKIALTRGKELYVVTHRVEPVIKIEMKQKKIIEPISYVEPDQSLTLQVDLPEVKVPQPTKQEEVVKKTRKTTKKPTEPKEEIQEKASKKTAPKKKKTVKKD